MSGISGAWDQREDDHGPESRPTRAYSTAVQCALVAAIGPRPSARAHHDAARALAERLEGEALRCAKVLAVLDLARSRACIATAAVARDAATRFKAWIKYDPPLVQRQEDLALWSEALRQAGALGLTVESDLAA
jgi:hypothetical protein